ncbi:serine hydrolase domain-containing protein [Nonomuraea sp. NPDC004297]
MNARNRLQSSLDALVGPVAVAAVAQVRDEHGTWRGASGVADLSTSRPARAGDLFRAGSIQKSLVATVVLQLVTEGRLDLDDPVERRLPGLVPGGARVTVRQLLAHTSGLPDYNQGLRITLSTFLTSERFAEHTPQDLLQLAAGAPPQFAPGEGWRYSNTNYLLLGMVVEQVENRRYEQVVRDRVLEAAGMRDAVLPGCSPFMPGSHLRAYAWPAGTPARPLDITVQSPTRAWASGDLICTAADVERFFSALFQGKLLGAEAMSAMCDPVPASSAGDRSYGLGVLRMTLPGGVTAWGGTGAYGGYLTLALTSEDAGRTLAISITPRSGQAMDALTRFASIALAGETGPAAPLGGMR